MATNTKPLKQRSTDELETAIQSGYVDNIQKSEAERILREHKREPDRKLARRTYNAAAWARAYSVIVALNCCIIALIIFWLGETSGRAPRQPAEAAEPETSLLAAPPIETAKPETSSLAVAPIAAPQESPAPPTEAAEAETLPPAAPPIETAEPEDLPPTATTIAEPKEAPAPPTEAAEPKTSPSAAPTVAAPESSVAFNGGSPCWGRPDDRFSRRALGYADAAQRGEHRSSTDCTRFASAYLKAAAPIPERSSSDHGHVEERDQHLRPVAWPRDKSRC